MNLQIYVMLPSNISKIYHFTYTPLLTETNTSLLAKTTEKNLVIGVSASPSAHLQVFFHIEVRWFL